jgi:hypothetical protein
VYIRANQQQIFGCGYLRCLLCDVDFGSSALLCLKIFSSCEDFQPSLRDLIAHLLLPSTGVLGYFRFVPAGTWFTRSYSIFGQNISHQIVNQSVNIRVDPRYGLVAALPRCIANNQIRARPRRILRRFSLLSFVSFALNIVFLRG